MRWAPAACLLLFAAAATLSLIGDAATFDETAHLPAGLSYLQRGDFRMNPEHPPLAKAWAALPLWVASTPVDYTGPAWSPRTSQWVFGYELLNGPRGHSERRDPRRLLIPARLMIVLLGVGQPDFVHITGRSARPITGSTSLKRNT